MLTLKYRPKTIADLIGQDTVRETLEHAFNDNKLANAYLLTGPRGAGKTSTARIIAKSINCKNKPAGAKATLSPCGTCSSCVNISNTNDLDVIEIDAASHGHVEDARSLIEKASLAAVNSDYKIYIIDEVHMLSNAAFNALLKLFEEPPANVIFILATTEAHKVLATIVSRCQQFRFKPISKEDCKVRLEEIAKLEAFNINSEALDFIAEESEGAMRDALSILEQISVYSKSDQVIDKALVEKVLGKVSQVELVELLQNIYLKRDSELLTNLSKILQKNPNSNILAEELFSNSISILNSLCLNDNRAEFLSVIDAINQANIPKSELVYISEELSKLAFQLRQSSQASKLLQALCLKLCFREDFIELKELKARLEKLENSGVSVSVKPQVPPVNSITPSPAPVPKIEPKAAPVSQVNSTEPFNQLEPEPKTESKVLPEPVELKTQSNFTDHNSFITELSPSCKGLFISSKASLASVENSIAKIHVPERFKFLKTKLESKSADFIQAIEKTSGNTITQINFELVAKTESNSIPQSSSVSEQAPKGESFNNKQTSRDTSIEAPKPELQASPPEQISTTNTDTCCDRESALDEVLEAGISIFGGSVVE